MRRVNRLAPKTTFGSSVRFVGVQLPCESVVECIWRSVLSQLSLWCDESSRIGPAFLWLLSAAIVLLFFDDPFSIVRCRQWEVSCSTSFSKDLSLVLVQPMELKIPWREFCWSIKRWRSHLNAKNLAKANYADDDDDLTERITYFFLLHSRKLSENAFLLGAHFFASSSYDNQTSTLFFIYFYLYMLKISALYLDILITLFMTAFDWNKRVTRHCENKIK